MKRALVSGIAGGRRRAAGLVRWAALALLLSACNGRAGPTATDTPGVSLIPEAPHLEPATLDRLFGSAGSYLQSSGDLELIAFRCTVVEGTFCWFGERTQDGAVAADLARTVVDQIGPQAIENANRNEVAVQCYRPTGAGDPYCEIDWGWGAGWQGLALQG